MFRRHAPHYQIEERILEIKARVRPEPYDWYRFDTFANVTQFTRLLPGGIEDVVRLAGNEPLADIGVADGDLSFLFESLGCAVTAIDWPGTNANMMRGVEVLRRELGSQINVRAIDLDDQFRFDGDRFGLVLALGLLYHLKNPYYFAEKLAIHSRRALFSTRILPRGTTKDAVARLVGEREFENDSSNYWFFSEAGIERLLHRCGWDITAKNISGDGRDDRYFCLAESRVAKTQQTIRLLDGWHHIENNAWRWTKREFAAVLENPPDASRFDMRFLVTPDVLAAGPLEISAEIDGVALGSEYYDSPGKHAYSRELPRRAPRHTVRVCLSHTFEAHDRELGVVITLPSRTIVDQESDLRLIRC